MSPGLRTGSYRPGVRSMPKSASVVPRPPGPRAAGPHPDSDRGTPTGATLTLRRSGPRVYRTARREGSRRHVSPTGEVGRLFRSNRFEVVWVYKRGEAVDPNWFSQSTTDVIAVVRGRLRVEFANARWRPRILKVGDVLVLPPRTKCRAYRWPRTARGATVFLAAYAVPGSEERVPRPLREPPRSST